MTRSGVDEPKSPDDAREWERGCLQAVEERVEWYRGKPYEPEVLETRLEGEYPETRLCVRYRGESGEQTRCLELWTTTYAPERGREPPAKVAILIYTYIGEHY